MQKYYDIRNKTRTRTKMKNKHANKQNIIKNGNEAGMDRKEFERRHV